ncbi:MAG: hypothetical protein Q8O87_02715, partial [bacterium]|nr:hypothetical protein [bacterium]
TRLEKEAVYYNNYALNRQYATDGRLINEALFKNTGKHLVVVKKDSTTLADLRDRLKEYNQIKYDKGRKISEINKSIADDLHLLGYNV